MLNVIDDFIQRMNHQKGAGHPLAAGSCRASSARSPWASPRSRGRGPPMRRNRKCTAQSSMSSRRKGWKGLSVGTTGLARARAELGLATLAHKHVPPRLAAVQIRRCMWAVARRRGVRLSIGPAYRWNRSLRSPLEALAPHPPQKNGYWRCPASSGGGGSVLEEVSSECGVTFSSQSTINRS